MSDHRSAETDVPCPIHSGCCGWCVAHDCAATACAHEHRTPTEVARLDGAENQPVRPDGPVQ